MRAPGYKEGMKLHILFGHRKESYNGEYSPEPLLCWSEYEVEENPEGFDDDVKKTLELRGKDFERTRMFLVQVDAETIVRRMYNAPVITGKLDPDEVS